MPPGNRRHCLCQGSKLPFLFGVKVNGKKYKECTQTDGGDVQDGADIPAGKLGYLLENDQRGIAGSHKEHIHRAIGNAPQRHIDSKGNDAQHKEGFDCGFVILYISAAPLEAMRYIPMKTRVMCQIKACRVSVQ